MLEMDSLRTDFELPGREFHEGIYQSLESRTGKTMIWKSNAKYANARENIVGDIHAEEVGPVHWTTAKIHYYVRQNFWDVLVNLLKKRRRIFTIPGGEKVASSAAASADLFLAWTADPKESMNDLIHVNARLYGKMESLGRSISAMQEIHPVLLDLPIPENDPVRSKHLQERLPSLRKTIERNGAKIVAERFPPEWNRLLFCFRHLHGSSDALKLTNNDFFQSAAFTNHQLATFRAAEAIALDYGLKDTKVFIETFPSQIHDIFHPEIAGALFEYDMGERYARDGKGIHFLQRAFAQEESISIRDLPPIDAGRRLVGLMVKNMLMQNIFGDGRLDQKNFRNTMERRFATPHRTLTRGMQQHLYPGDLGILIYGGGHFQGNDKYPIRMKCGFLEEYLSNTPHLAYMIVEAEFDNIRSKVSELISRMLTSNK